MLAADLGSGQDGFNALAELVAPSSMRIGSIARYPVTLCNTHYLSIIPMSNEVSDVGDTHNQVNKTK